MAKFKKPAKVEHEPASPEQMQAVTETIKRLKTGDDLGEMFEMMINGPAAMCHFEGLVEYFAPNPVPDALHWDTTPADWDDEQRKAALNASDVIKRRGQIYSYINALVELCPDDAKGRAAMLADAIAFAGIVFGLSFSEWGHHSIRVTAANSRGGSEKGRAGKAAKTAELHKNIAKAVSKTMTTTGWTKSAAQIRVAEKSPSLLGKRVSLSTVERACKTPKK